MPASSRPIFLRKLSTASGLEGLLMWRICLDASMAFSGERPIEVIRYPAMNESLGEGFLTAAVEKKRDEKMKIELR
ncbi:hypothetical protein IEQ34_017264 [Dendrobium chrysotoxum]|uniref:Uncharacterized protein n=1 Tax=Dendrobium chrysotoxum TaxID=161865 RepID=A0AAV7FTF5_DENCH|nr:hypothetical protein IEQ34_017264 [Dendrobium chrysotoxum]